MNDITVFPELAQHSPQESFAFLMETVVQARQQIGQNFLALGQALSLIKSRRLYEQGGFDSFYAFLRDKRVDIASQDAERFMAITEDPQSARSLTMGLSKMLELMKLPAPQREQLLARGAELNGSHKSLDEMNLKEMRQAAQELKREGKQRCERCRRWVEQLKELDGRLFGDGEGHNCYALELEERQSLAAGRLAPARMDQVLDSLRLEQTPPEAPPLQWLPESLFQVYGQLLQEQSDGEVSREALERERETLRKLMHLCQTRLQDVQQTLKALEVLEADD
ncbi:MAG: hypothetical protein IGS03_04960 [Candidatus Sericytochromatia bacterium]|nr:hypothetical protein [Candidatus Sericytochromatia bacterium]